ncbi:MAG: ArgE/DapE family deacylase [Phycicoccus sp.]|nr:ArgE/DapE family deacylase [Phycicoccus sp.]
MTGPDLTAVECRVLEAIDEAALVADLVHLVRVPSVTGSDAEADLQHQHGARLAELGFDVDLWDFDLEALTAHPDFPGTEAPRTQGYGLAATLGPWGTPALVLQGHVDVVPTGDVDKWGGGDPWSGAITGTTLRGRGACDMKAGAAVNLAVAHALVASGVNLARPLAVHSVVSEEDGGLGAFATMLRGHRGDVAVIPEPTSGRVVTANAGALTFELKVAGQAAHGSAPYTGYSALTAFLPVYAALDDLQRRRNTEPDPRYADNPMPYPISVGTVRSGDWASSVPDLLVAQGRLGVRLGEEPHEARTEFEHAIAEVCARDPWLADHPVEVSWPGGQFASGQLDSGHGFVRDVLTVIRDVEGRDAALGAAPYGSDLRLYAGMGGIATLHYGPGDVAYAHAPREQVEIPEVIAVARTLAVLAARQCGAHL